jgi:membrane protein YqaA with SNARE-associated domain
MPISKTLLYIFIFFYVAVSAYLLAFFLIPDFQNLIIEARGLYINLTEGGNYFIALLIAFFTCLIGSASIGFPIPFPFILFTLSNAVLAKYGNSGLFLEQILVLPNFWFEILGFVVIGGLGCAIGELAGYVLGYSSEKLLKKTESQTMKNLNGFGKLILENEGRAPLYIFIFALTPLPDDILFIPLGLIRYPWYKAIIPGWLGKTFTTLFYCTWPILLQIGFIGAGMELNVVSDVVTESIMLIVTLSVMMFIFSFDWGRYAEDREKRKQEVTE